MLHQVYKIIIINPAPKPDIVLSQTPRPSITDPAPFDSTAVEDGGGDPDPLDTVVCASPPSAVPDPVAVVAAPPVPASILANVRNHRRQI
jgi:hypothetical protein